MVRETVNKNIDIVFGGEIAYKEGHKKYFPEAEYVILDPERTKWNISGTEIRKNPYLHWDYIVGSARPFFSKRVLITGPESCGKTTLTKKLAKIFYTSWSEEVGRVYQETKLGGNGSLFELDDFDEIAQLQDEQDKLALAKASKVCFFDTDAVITLYYSDFFMKAIAPKIKSFVNPQKYDLVIALKPSVPWVDDGTRYTGEQKVRDEQFVKIIKLYQQFGFDINNFVIVDSSNYYDRLELCIAEVQKLIEIN
jgi:HTH-type transcriptional repressor of NAD biosynthesis genes